MRGFTRRIFVLAMALSACINSWAQTGNVPAVQQLLALFVDLRAFGAACGIATVIQDTNTRSFAMLSPDKLAGADFC
jgi:hypothetical protein